MNFEDQAFMLFIIGSVITSSGLFFDMLTLQGINMSFVALSVEVIGILIIAHAMGRYELGKVFSSLVTACLFLEIPANLYFGFTGILVYFPQIAALFLLVTVIGIITGQNSKLKEKMHLMNKQWKLHETFETMQDEIKVLAET